MPIVLFRNTSANYIHSKHFCQLYSFETLSSAWATQKYQLTSTCCRRFSSRLLCSFQPHRNGFVRELRFGAARAEVATKTALEIRDALALWCLFAWLFARSEVGVFARRLLHVDLASAPVAFDVGAGILPRALRGCGFYEWSVFDVLHAWWVCCKGIRANTPCRLAHGQQDVRILSHAFARMRTGNVNRISYRHRTILKLSITFVRFFANSFCQLYYDSFTMHDRVPRANKVPTWKIWL